MKHGTSGGPRAGKSGLTSARLACQSLGVVLDASRGCGVDGRRAWVVGLDVRALQLGTRIANGDVERQPGQPRVLFRWATWHLSGDPKANLVVLGDFNEGHPVGSEVQALAVLFQARPPMVDSLSTLSVEIPTHTDGKAYDRILVSEAIAKGLNRLKLEAVVIQPHRHGNGKERRLYTDHFPVVAAHLHSRRVGWTDSHACSCWDKTAHRVAFLADALSVQ